MKKIVSIVFLTLTGLVSCSETKTETEELSDKVSIEGQDYKITAHVYYEPTNPERRGSIHFMKDSWQGPSIAINSITNPEISFFIFGALHEQSFDTITGSPSYFSGMVHNLPDWPAGEPVIVFFSFDYNGNNYKMKYNTQICNHY